MPNGKHGDNPLSDMTIHGAHPFPSDIEELLRHINTLGRALGRWPLGENWPYSPPEFDWEKGRNLSEARQLLSRLVVLLEAGRGDEVLINPSTGKPFAADKQVGAESECGTTLQVTRTYQDLTAFDGIIPTTMAKVIWVGTIEISYLDHEDSDKRKNAFTVVTTWASSPEEFRENCVRMLESYGWKLLDVERANPAPEAGEFSEEVEDMLERTRNNPNAIIYGTFYSYPVM